MNYFSRWVKQSYVKVGFLSLLALLLCGAQPAGAAVISSAAIDWSTFKITPIDIGNGLPTLTWTSQNDRSDATIGFCCGSTFENASNWSTGTLATESGATSTYSRSASASTSVNEINANASINGAPNQHVSTGSSSFRSGEFTVQGAGDLRLEAKYSLAVDSGTVPDASAISSVFGVLSSSEPCSRPGICWPETFSDSIGGGFPPVSETGTVDLELFFQDGDRGSFFVGTSASVTAVPLPAAFWLFGSALAGVAALRRSTIGRLKVA